MRRDFKCFSIVVAKWMEYVKVKPKIEVFGNIDDISNLGHSDTTYGMETSSLIN